MSRRWVAMLLGAVPLIGSAVWGWAALEGKLTPIAGKYSNWVWISVILLIGAEVLLLLKQRGGGLLLVLGGIASMPLGLLAILGAAVLRGGPDVTRRRLRPSEGTGRCACGYDLTGIDKPRCPECGCLIGFTVPLDEMGLTEAELKSGFSDELDRRDR